MKTSPSGFLLPSAEQKLWAVATTRSMNVVVVLQQEGGHWTGKTENEWGLESVHYTDRNTELILVLQEED